MPGSCLAHAWLMNNSAERTALGGVFFQSLRGLHQRTVPDRETLSAESDDSIPVAITVEIAEVFARLAPAEPRIVLQRAALPTATLPSANDPRRQTPAHSDTCTACFRATSESQTPLRLRHSQRRRWKLPCSHALPVDAKSPNATRVHPEHRDEHACLLSYFP